MRVPTILGLLLLPTVLAACGGGGGGDGEGGSDLVTLRVAPTPSRTGTVYSNTTVIVGAELMVVGDSAANDTAHAYASFPLASLPDPANIVRVVYEDAQTSASGTPYASLGDIVAVSTDLGPSLDATDFDGPLVSVNLGTLSSASGAGPRTLDVTAWTLSLLDSGGDRLDLMFRFEDETDHDGVTDAVWLRDTHHVDGPGVLLVTFHGGGPAR